MKDHIDPLYYKKLSKFELIDPEEQRELFFELRRNGDPRIREKLILHNLSMVVFFAKKYRGRGLLFDDLISAGNVGLILAVDNYDPGRGPTFATYAAYRIKREIIYALVKNRMLGLPYNFCMILSNIRRNLTEEQATVENIFQKYDVTREEAERLKNAYHSTKDMFLVDDDDFLKNIKVQEPDNHHLENADSLGTIKDFLVNLDKREAQVLILYFGLGDDPPITLRQIAKRMGRSPQRASQILNKALAKIRERFRDD